MGAFLLPPAGISQGNANSSRLTKRSSPPTKPQPSSRHALLASQRQHLSKAAFRQEDSGQKPAPETLEPLSPTASRMLACRILSALLASASLVLLLTALITDYWIVAYGPKDIMHSGLWQVCRDGNCFVPDVAFDYIKATRVLLIMASLTNLAVLIVHIASFTPSDCGVLDKPVTASVAAFIAGLFSFMALVVFTTESWGKNVDPQIDVTFEWSFYLGWATFPVLLLAGLFSLVAQLCSSRSDYRSI